MSQTPTDPVANPGARLLIVDDEAHLLNGYHQIMKDAGYLVDTASNGGAAIDLVQRNNYDAVISDISMPGMTGLDLLRSVRQYDLDVPVILMTGGPAVETAIIAIEHGAFRYLIKPVEPALLRQNVHHAVLLHKIAKVKREALRVLGDPGLQEGDRAGADARLTSALDTLFVAFQPIISWQHRTIFGYEALVRCREASLPHPGAMIDAAERLGRLQDLSRAIRASVAQAIPKAPPEAVIFVNLHTRDLLDEALYSETAILAPFAERIVYEITERTALDEVSDVASRMTALRQLGYRIAIDDLGAGYAGLSTFAQLEPEVVKLDMSLIRDVHLQPTKRKLIHSMVALCEELNMRVIAEGIEQVAEREVLAELGIDLMQGYLFGRPAPTFEAASFT